MTEGAHTGPPGRRSAGRAVTRRRIVAVAGHQGDEQTARRGLVDASAPVRATALGALARMGRLLSDDVSAALADHDPQVRRRAAEVAARLPGVALGQALGDPDPTVVEAAAWALGERRSGSVAELGRTVRDHPDPQCREAAVAALGVIGDRSALPDILAALADRPPVRRRAVLALAPFEGPEVDAALRRAGEDRDWQVRQAAEDLVVGTGPDAAPGAADAP